MTADAPLPGSSAEKFWEYTMSALSSLVDTRLAQLPRTMALEWPGGRAHQQNQFTKVKISPARPGKATLHR